MTRAPTYAEARTRTGVAVLLLLGASLWAGNMAAEPGDSAGEAEGAGGTDETAEGDEPAEGPAASPTGARATSPAPQTLPMRPQRLFPTRLKPIPHQEPPAPLVSLSAQACNACHGQIHDEWAASGHARASTNPVYLAATEALGDPPLCRECHLPLQNQRATLARGPAFLGATAQEPNPGHEPTLALEGVTCAACHVRAGVILGPRALPSDAAPHRVLRSTEFQGVDACSFCHQLALPGAKEHPFLDTVGEWRRSPFSEAGITCQECHMPRVSGVIGGSRYAAFASHLGLGNRSREALRRALTLEVTLSGPSLERGQSIDASARLMNTGAGHAVPTGDPSHLLELRFEVEGRDGQPAKGAGTVSHWLAREVEAESPFAQLSDTRLQAMETRSFDFQYTVPRNQDPGRFVLRVSVHWWSVSHEQAKATGLKEEAVRHLVIDQRIPFEVF